MLRIIPKEEQERRNDIEGNLKNKIIELGMKHGVPFELIDDSRRINKAIGNVSYALEKMREMIEYHGTTTIMHGSNRQRFQPIPGYKNPTFDHFMKDSKKFEEAVKKDAKKGVKRK